MTRHEKSRENVSNAHRNFSETSGILSLEHLFKGEFGNFYKKHTNNLGILTHCITRLRKNFMEFGSFHPKQLGLDILTKVFMGNLGFLTKENSGILTQGNIFF